jgi:lipolytic protein G-D-S-L family
MEEEYKVQVERYVRFVEEKKAFRFRDLANYAVPGKIVLLGDSLTEEFPLRELLPDFYVYNRGYSGDTSEDLENRLSYSCYSYLPRAVFLQIGTNDLAKGRTPEQTTERIRQVCSSLRRKFPKMSLYVLSLYPMNVSAEKFRRGVTFGMVNMRTNAQIRETNKRLKKMCEEKGYPYVDVFSSLTDESGELREEFSSDGLHLTVKGYSAVAKILYPYLKKEQKIETEN